MRETSQGDDRVSGSRRIALVLGGVAFALTPWVTLGFGTVVAYLVVAVLFRHLGRVRSLVLWTSTAVYTAALVITLIGSGDSPDALHEGLLAAGLLLNVVIAGMQALVLLTVAIVKGYRPRLHRLTPMMNVDVPPSDETAVRPGAHRVELSRSDRLATKLMLIVGPPLYLGLMIVLTFGLTDDIHFAGHHRSVPATVVSVEKSTNCLPNGGCTDEYRPTVAFVTADGRSMRVATGDSVYPDERAAYAVGRSIIVYYDPDDPQDARVDPSLGGFDALTLACYLIGAALGVQALVRARRRRRVEVNATEEIAS